MNTNTNTNENENTANEAANRQMVDNFMDQAMKESRQAYDEKIIAEKRQAESNDKNANGKPDDEETTMEKAGEAISKGAENVQDGIHWAGRKMKESLLPSDSASQFRSN